METATSVTGLDIASFVLGLVGTILGAWSIAEYYLSGPRAKVRLRRSTFFIRVHMDESKPLQREELLHAVVRCRGRLPISIEDWGIEVRQRPWSRRPYRDHRPARTDVLGPAPPLRLEAYEGQEFQVDLRELQLLADEFGWKGSVWLRGRAALGTGKTKRSPFWRQLRIPIEDAASHTKAGRDGPAP